ncbi:epsilon-sarcoglycan-like [Ctenocephalides felis]|uniref:epsilon-sarcoglycan-like n=1 Tax=Ctenocephalides felis TaxID=7515 RepID=UPI000E6E33F5|nr:epsilon-sarcoglycan-like [Ctenocephalides felis]
MFSIKIEPRMFNWTFQGLTEQYSYSCSLLGLPDLPSWLRYTYSKQQHAGFLYGTPPVVQQNLQIQVIGLNYQNYETRTAIIEINVHKKPLAVRHEVQLKIDSLNVEDMLDPHRMDRLLDVFKKKMWREATDIYVTFVESAIHLGARLPLMPDEKEGVVVRLASSKPYSTELTELQEEVKPLFKLTSCPRDFKRTTVERIFRDAAFALDWCAFRLQDNYGSVSRHQSEDSKIASDPHDAERWFNIRKDQVPERSYSKDITMTVLIPGSIFIVFTAMLWVAIFDGSSED